MCLSWTMNSTILWNMLKRTPHLDFSGAGDQHQQDAAEENSSSGGQGPLWEYMKMGQRFKP